MPRVPDGAAYLEAILAAARGQGQAGNIVRDRDEHLFPPEAARWTGKRYQLAYLVSGLTFWLELRLDRYPLRQEHEPLNFEALLRTFIEREDKLP